MENRANILICTNASYLQHVAVCLSSLITNSPAIFFNIVVVSRSGEFLDEKKLSQSLSFSKQHTIAFRQFSPPPDCFLPLNPNAGYTLDIWTRLWVDEFFERDVDRVLYLDGDIVITGDISPLWHCALDGALLGAVDIPGSPQGVERLGLRPQDGYFNSGVLLIDLKQWRDTGALKEVLRYVSMNSARLHDPDQDALNGCFYHRRKRLEYKWNAIRPFFRKPIVLPLSPDEIDHVLRDVRVIHYNGVSKPWSYFCDHPRRGEYNKYLQMTEWRNFVPADRTPINVLRKHVARILPTSLKHLIKLIAAK